MWWNREAAQKQFRPEQFRLRDYLAKSGHNAVIEYVVEGIGIADLYDSTTNTIYLMDSGSHQYAGRNKKKKDELQIEKYKEAGFEVILVNKDSFEWNWLWK